TRARHSLRRGDRGRAYRASRVVTDSSCDGYGPDHAIHPFPTRRSSGLFLRAWGKDVVAGGGTGFEICTVAADCQLASSGGLGGEVDGPAGVRAADRSVGVVGKANEPSQKFESSGNVLRGLGEGVGAGGGRVVD